VNALFIMLNLGNIDAYCNAESQWNCLFISAFAYSEYQQSEESLKSIFLIILL
jgi:hypothetical protein